MCASNEAKVGVPTMGKEDVRRALEAMARDDGVRAAAERGELDDLGGEALTEQERALVVGAAREWPEVEGFAQPTVSTSDLGQKLQFQLGLSPDAMANLPNLQAAMNYCSSDSWAGVDRDA